MTSNLYNILIEVLYGSCLDRIPTKLADEGTDIESSGVASGQAAIADPQGIFDDIGKDLCKIGCDTAAAAATAACSSLSGGVAIAACIAAAAAREVCRDNC